MESVKGLKKNLGDKEVRLSVNTPPSLYYCESQENMSTLYLYIDLLKSDIYIASYLVVAVSLEGLSPFQVSFPLLLDRGTFSLIHVIC